MAFEKDGIFIPIDFERRNLEGLLADISLLKKILRPEDAALIVPALEASGDRTDLDRITLIARCFGITENFYDISNMGFLFRTIGEYCQIPVPAAGHTFKTETYRPNEGHLVVQASASDHFNEGRDRLREASPNSQQDVLAFFNSSHALARRRLYERIREDLGVEFDVTEVDGILRAQQRVPQFAHPVYALRRLEGNSAIAQMQVQRYDSQLAEFMSALTKH
ncbi:hypothetical protein HYX07_01550 [Candidatus Woesearchaeota archaeon]|nr:hypothetical protein [Candidatus Woesearchaeota archaeon]